MVVWVGAWGGGLCRSRSTEKRSLFFLSLSSPLSRPTHRSTAEHILTVCKDADAVALLATLSDDGMVAHAAAAVGHGTLTRQVSRAGAAAAAAAAEAAGAPTAILTAGTLKHGSRQPSLASAEAGRVNCSLRAVGAGGDAAAATAAAASGCHHAPPPATSTGYQIAVLSVRFLRSWARTPALAGVQLAQYLFFAILLGATYWRLGDHAARDGAAAGVFDRVASLWFVVLCCVLQPGANACTIMYGQKALLRREAGGGLYRTRAFFVAKSLTSLPFQLLFAFVFNAIIYFCVGYQATCAKFAVFFGVNLLAMLVSESLGVLAAALHRSELIGQIMLSLLFVPLLMYTGFIQTRSPVSGVCGVVVGGWLGACFFFASRSHSPSLPPTPSALPRLAQKAVFRRLRLRRPRQERVWRPQATPRARRAARPRRPHDPPQHRQRPVHRGRRRHPAGLPGDAARDRVLPVCARGADAASVSGRERGVVSRLAGTHSPRPLSPFSPLFFFTLTSARPRFFLSTHTAVL